MIIELLSRRAEMLVFEFDDVLFALKYSRPALEPLFQLPPTIKTCQPDEEYTPNAQRRSATRRQSLFRLKFALCKTLGVATPSPPKGMCDYASHRRRADSSSDSNAEPESGMESSKPA